MSTRLTRAFTLIELLVVIAIIALLVSILLPSLTKAKDLAKSSSCLVNMRNVGSVLQQYLSEYQDMLPPLSTYVTGALGTAQVDNWAKEASGMSDAAWAADQANFGTRGCRGWNVPLWPYYKSLKLFICPSDPWSDLTSLTCGDRGVIPQYWGGGEAYGGAPRQSYFRNTGTAVGDFGGWHTSWAARQTQALSGQSWGNSVTVEKLQYLHSRSASSLWFMGDQGSSRSTSSFWGGFYGAIGGGRDNGTVNVWDNRLSIVCAGTTETHPRLALGTATFHDYPDGGSSYMYLDGHATNSMAFPSEGDMGCLPVP